MSELETTHTTKRNNGGYIAVILVLLVGLGVMAYFLSSTKSDLTNCHNDVAMLQSDMEGMNQMMSGYVDNMSNDLRADFQNMLANYDELMKKDRTQTDSIMVQKERIQGLIDELNSNKKLSASQLVKLRKENETLRNIMKGYVMQIDSLNTLNLQLTSDLTATTNELSVTSTERDQFKEEAQIKSEQVRKGSKLQAYNISSTGLRMKLNNTTEETNKARSTVQIRSTFTISENPITPAGNKTVYMQIIDPSGRTLQNRSSNTVSTDAGTIPYSDKKDVDYRNEQVDMAIYYDLKGAEPAKGNYRVKIYCDGQLIGNDSFTLK